jgi:hypothetical protein
MSKKIILVLLSVISYSLYAQMAKDTVALRFANSIKASDLKDYMYVLASDSLEGRETGEIGQKKAAKYIADFFLKNNLEPGFLDKNGRSFFQPFGLLKSQWKESSLVVKNTSYQYLKDYYMQGSFKADIKNADVVFVGFGIETTNYNDYKDKDVKNKVVLFFSGEPINSEGINLVTNKKGNSSWANAWRKKVKLAKDKGALAAIMITGTDTPLFEQYAENISKWLEKPVIGFPNDEENERSIPFFNISPKVGAALLGIKNDKSLADFRTLNANGKTKKMKLSKVTLKANRLEEEITSENVLGFIEGTDKKDEIVVITAHYDHLGKWGGKIYYGADDDASGTVSVMEIAQAFSEAKKAGKGPRRSILIMPVSGEEKGLLGSDYYTRNPVYPLEKTVCDLNIDMVGRLDADHKENEDYVYLIGADKLSTQLHELSEKANNTYTNLELNYRYNDEEDPNRFYYRSDHYNFAKNGIPVIFYFNGTHDDYHQPTDTKEKILYNKMEKIARLVFFTAWEIANREEKLVVDKPFNKE